MTAASWLIEKLELTDSLHRMLAYAAAGLVSDSSSRYCRSGQSADRKTPELVVTGSIENVCAKIKSWKQMYAQPWTDFGRGFRMNVG
jgi:hypothetical protein